MVIKAIKKPVEIEAIQWTGYNLEDVLDFTKSKSNVKMHNQLVVQTLEGDMVANVEDFIIKGIKGEFYPCKPDIFHLTYTII